MKIKNLFLKSDKKFAKGVCFDKLLFIFIIGSIIGTYYEQIYNLIEFYIEDGSIFWESRRGLIYGPFSPIYGAGAVLMTRFLCKKEHKWYNILFYGSFIGGGFEYLISFLQETFVGTISWDYSTYFLNINGRTTIPYMIFWGCCALLYVKVIYPFFSNYIEKIPYNLGKCLSKAFVAFMVINMFLSWGALIRQSFRRDNKPAYTVLGTFFDKYYTDDFLYYYYPNMVKVGDQK